MSDITDEIDKFRAVLKHYDDGRISAAECHSMLHGAVMDPLLAALEKGEKVMAFGSCCCSGHPPTRTFDVHFSIEPHGYQIGRTSPVTSTPNP